MTTNNYTKAQNHGKPDKRSPEAGESAEELEVYSAEGAANNGLYSDLDEEEIDDLATRYEDLDIDSTVPNHIERDDGQEYFEIRLIGGGAYLIPSDSLVEDPEHGEKYLEENHEQVQEAWGGENIRAFLEATEPADSFEYEHG